MLQFHIDNIRASQQTTENKQGAGWVVAAHLQFQMWTSQQWTPSGILRRCDLDLIKNLTSYPVQIKPKLPRCSFCLCVTFGSEAAFATGPGKQKHNEGNALKALQVQLIREILDGSFHKQKNLWEN